MLSGRQVWEQTFHEDCKKIFSERKSQQGLWLWTLGICRNGMMKGLYSSMAVEILLQTCHAELAASKPATQNKELMGWLGPQCRAWKNKSWIQWIGRRTGFMFEPKAELHFKHLVKPFSCVQHWISRVVQWYNILEGLIDQTHQMKTSMLVSFWHCRHKNGKLSRSWTLWSLPLLLWLLRIFLLQYFVFLESWWLIW